MVEQQKEKEIVLLFKKLWGMITLNREYLDRLEYDKLVASYDEKYPVRPLYYSGNVVNLRNYKNMPLTIQVCDYIHVTQSMRDWIVEKELVFDKPVTIENVCVHIWKIYSEFTKHTKYRTDADLYGVNEQWIPNMSQFYITEKNKWIGDCENFALLCAGLIEASGVPRGLYRCTAGMTKLGGHCSLTAYDPIEKQWVQYETTATKPKVIFWGDDIYINTVWFSFDSTMSFSNKKTNDVEVRGDGK